MAPRWNSLLCSVLLAGHAIAEEDYEVFPLSGGIDNGVTVTIDIQGFDFQNAKIEFLKPNRETAFGLTFDGQKITRSWALGENSGSYTYGGWPTELTQNGPATFAFTKRSSKWAVTIGNKRYPWFDFMHKHESSDLLTHVRVYSGMTNAEVTLERKECSIRCHPDECKNDAGNETHPTYVVTGDSMECIGSMETTPDAGQHCCDGQESILSTEASINSFAVVHDDQEYVARVCNAFGLAGCAGKPEFSSKKVQIQTVNQESGTINAFVPFAQNTPMQPPDFDLPSDALFDFPRFALKMPKPVETKLVEFAAGANPFASGTLQAPDGHNQVILAGDAGGELPKGWFVNMIKIQRRANNVDYPRWVVYSRAVDVQGINELKMQVSDEPQPATTCSDTEGWRDVYGNECGNYTAGDWCNIHAETTPAGDAAWAAQDCGQASCLGTSGLPNGQDVRAFRASFECCHCGGGDHEAPQSQLMMTRTILQ